jgi:hypothetical protein
MSVWLVLPSARPVAEVNARMDKWKAMGYKIALWRDVPAAKGSGPAFPYCEILMRGKYPGYARAVNSLVAEVIKRHPEVEWFVAAGDDTDPDPKRIAAQIARECSDHFHGTFGVMQPTGDPWRDVQGKIIDRIAGSPWLGREWCRRANRGQGPFWPEFTHMFGDQMLQEYAKSLGVFWQRPDLTHYHDHAQRDPNGNYRPPAPHMAQWNTPQHWQQSKAIFDRLVAGNFQECAPIP